MPTALRFYKTKMNRGNRAYDGAALDNILDAAPSVYIVIQPTIIPDVDFYFMSGTASTTDYLLGGYDYFSYEYNGRTWYSFIDDIQPIASDVGKFRVSHTTDRWAMAIKYFMGANGTFHMNGTLERAHVNDLVLSDTLKTSAYPDMSYTLANTEAPYNTQLLRCVRNTAYKALYSGLRYLYLYIANPRELGVDVENDRGMPQRWLVGDFEDFDDLDTPTFGMLLVYIIGNNGRVYYRSSSGAGSKGGWFDIRSLTSSAITAMYISDIPPCSYADNYSGVTLGSGGASVTPYIWDENAPNIDSFYAKAPNTTEGLPPYLNWFYTINGVSQIYVDMLSTEPISNGIISKQTDFTEYLKRIPKMRSTIYNPIMVGDYRIAPQKGQSINQYINTANWKQSITPDLQYIVTVLPDNYDYLEGQNKFIITANRGVFASDTVLDYWTRLNATQSTIAANKSQFNAVMQPIVSGLSSLGSSMSEGTTAGLKLLKSDVSGVADMNVFNMASKTGGLVQSIGNAVYSWQSAANAKELAQQQYNAGTTISGNTLNSYSGSIDSSEAIFNVYSCELQYDIIAPNLHKYGYSTLCQIDEIYTNHRRKYFNYFKGVDVSVSGMPIAWCNEIADMFNNGVTLWQSDVENYERCNYQVNLNW